MKKLFTTVLFAALSATAFAQAPAQPAKPAAKAAAKPAAKPAAKADARKAAKAPAKAPSRRVAVELAAPLEEADPSIKLTEADLAVAKRVHVGEIACELGQKVTIKPLKREGFFLVARGVNRFVMHPVESRTGAIRLEDPVRGALWLQLGNKSMLMNQKEGKRLADECASPEQLQFAKDMKPVNLLEPAPTPPTAPVAPSAAAPSAAPAPAQ